ncbi:MAG: protein-export chaperone SecB [Alkalibacterium sp.]|nr:protein-export chaperone SecB [Alkalibacterium sp.]
MDKPVIEFKGYRIENIDFKHLDSEEFSEIDLENGNVAVWAAFTDDYKEAKLRLTFTVVDDNLYRTLVFEISGYFDINCSKEMADTYLIQNGTAILYPYARSIISMITSLDNENTIVIPTINTTTLLEE